MPQPPTLPDTVKPFRILVLGGYGNFGSIIVRRLSQAANIHVLIAGRDLHRAQALAGETGGEAVCLDMNCPDLIERLKALQADVLISTAGPFQGQDYRVARAALAARMHYVDLADARAFVCGIDQLDAEARDAGVLVCSGASSVPTLSAAVVDHFLPCFSRLDGISHGISSAAKMPGKATLASVLNYCGKPFQQWRQGRWQPVYGWQGMMTHRFLPPLGKRWVVNCDVPDLELFPQRYPTVENVSFLAGTGLKSTLFGAWVLSWLVRIRLLKSALPLTDILYRLAQKLEGIGNGRSGMFVRLQGTGHDGQPLGLCWELHAHNDHGLNIPCMAAVVLARKLAAGTLHQQGAIPCMGLVTLEEYLAEMENLDIEQCTKQT